MFVRIDHSIDEPLYSQICSQIIAGIARGELVAGEALPSVRRLASDLGINLHTVNKAYAVLRDEGYIVMKGRAGAFVAQAALSENGDGAFDDRMRADLEKLAVFFKAKGGTFEAFIEHVTALAEGVFCIDAQSGRGDDGSERGE